MMMTKEKWNEIRKDEEFDTEVLYNFFIELGGNKDLTISEFAAIFEQIDGKVIVGSNGVPKAIRHDTTMEKVREHYDRKFGK
jgi:hypothetical protein